MNDQQERIIKFEKRRAELRKLSDEELKKRFWELCNKVVEPLLELARTHTSPSIERSVLLRMGIDSLTTKAVVDKIIEAGLLGKGAGHVVLKVAQKYNIDLRAAAKKIVDDPACMSGLFGR